MGWFVYTVGQRFNEIELVRQESRTWVCRCHCGNEFKPKSMHALRGGKLKSCGCNSTDRFSYAPGQRFHDIEVLRQVVGGWVCRCHCGKDFTAENMTRLRQGNLRSCGCINAPFLRPFVPYVAGQRYSDIELVKLEPDGWVCRCHCGEEFTPKSVVQLRAGNVKSCGCRKQKAKRNDPLYSRFKAVSQQRKTGRLCERWSSFEGFKADMEDAYFEGARLDRHDLGKSYSLENCFWSTAEAYEKRRGMVKSRPIVECPCGNSFRQQTVADLHCSRKCIKNFGGVVSSISLLTPEEVEEMKAEILQGVRGYCRRLANRFGLTLPQVWVFAKKVKAGAHDCPTGQ